MLNNRQLETLYWAGKLSSSPRQRRTLTPRNPPFLCASASSRAHWGRLFSTGVTARLASPRRAASFGYAEQIRVSERTRHGRNSSYRLCRGRFDHLAVASHLRHPCQLPGNLAGARRGADAASDRAPRARIAGCSTGRPPGSRFLTTLLGSVDFAWMARG
jgi:hypothetical protein